MKMRRDEEERRGSVRKQMQKEKQIKGEKL